jgi:hypothetical protein
VPSAADIRAAAWHSVVTNVVARDPGDVIDVIDVSGGPGAGLPTGPGRDHHDGVEDPSGAGVVTAAPEAPLDQLAPDPISLTRPGTVAVTAVVRQVPPL